MVGASIHLRGVRSSAYLEYAILVLLPISGSTEPPPFFPLLFSAVHAERMVLYIRRCFPFKLNLTDQS